MEQTGDKELIRLIRLSDYQAFEELHERFWPELQRIAYKKTGDRQDAYDLLQDMFIELWEKREELHFGDRLQGWLQKRLWFKLSGYFRIRGFRQQHQEDFKMYLENEPAEVSFDPIELKEIDAYYEDLISAINKTIEEMPDRMREVFLLNRNEKHSVNEIAQMLNLSPKTVRNQLDRAITRLRKSTESYNPSVFQFLFVLWIMKN